MSATTSAWVPEHRRIAGSTVALVGANALIGLLGVLALRQMTHELGATSYGVLSEALNLVVLTTILVDLGVTTYGGREIARDLESAPTVLGNNLGLRLAMSLLMIPIVTGFGFLLYPSNVPHLEEGIFLIACTLPFEAIRAVSVSYYVATIQNYKTAAIAVASQFFYVGGILVALHLGLGLTGCFVAYLCGMGLTALTAYLAVRRHVRFRPLLSISQWGTIIRQSLGIGSIQVVNVLYARTNILLLSVLVGAHSVAIYAVASQIVTFFLIVPNSFMTSMMPLLVRATGERLTTLVESSVAYLAMAGMLVLAGTWCLAGSVTTELTPGGFSKSADVLSLLVFSLTMTCVTSVFAYTSFARNFHHRLFFISFGGLLLNIVLDIALIPMLHERGAAVATDIVEFALLVGTFAVFRLRVGDHFGDWWRLARIVVVGGTVTAVSRPLITSGFASAPARIGVGVVGVPIVIVVLFFACRCFPPSFRVRTVLDLFDRRRPRSQSLPPT